MADRGRPPPCAARPAQIDPLWSVVSTNNRQKHLDATLRLLQLVAVVGKELFEGRNVCLGFFGRS